MFSPRNIDPGDVAGLSVRFPIRNRHPESTSVQNRFKSASHATCPFTPKVLTYVSAKLSSSSHGSSHVQLRRLQPQPEAEQVRRQQLRDAAWQAMPFGRAAAGIDGDGRAAGRIGMLGCYLEG